MSSSIVLGGGCFWCLEAVYQQVTGVISVMPGYAGDSKDKADYQTVSSGTTKHVEVVKVVFDPGNVSLDKIMAIFWTIHNPTSLNRQGYDIGPQYASVIFYSDDEQLRDVQESMKSAQKHLASPIVTRIEPLDEFYPAEPEHVNYFANNPNAGYCQAVIEPKLMKLRQHYSTLLSY